jgi:hypothetical protein
MYALLAYAVIAVMILFIATITAGIMLGTGIMLFDLVCRVFASPHEQAIAPRTERVASDVLA